MINNNYVEALKKSGYKITPQRLAVIDFISANPGHFTADQVFREIKKREPTVTLATVYNIFRAMKSSGIIQSFEVNGSMIYESNNIPHANFICTSCGSIRDYPADGQEFLNLAKTDGSVVQSVDIVIKGLCPKCASEKSVRTHSIRSIKREKS